MYNIKRKKLIANLSVSCSSSFYVRRTSTEESESDNNFKIKEEKFLKEFSPNFKVMIKIIQL